MVFISAHIISSYTEFSSFENFQRIKFYYSWIMNHLSNQIKAFLDLSLYNENGSICFLNLHLTLNSKSYISK